MILNSLVFSLEATACVINVVFAVAWRNLSREIVFYTMEITRIGAQTIVQRLRLGQHIDEISSLVQALMNFQDTVCRGIDFRVVWTS